MWTQTRKAFLPRYLLKMKAACFHWLGRQNKQTRKAVQRGGLCKTKPCAQGLSEPPKTPDHRAPARNMQSQLWKMEEQCKGFVT